MKISSFIIVMLLVSGVIISLYNFELELASNTAWVTPNVNRSYQDTYDKITQLQNITQKTQDTIQNITSKEDKSFFTGTWDAFRLTKTVTFGAVGTTVTGLSVGTTLITDFINDLNVGSENTHVTTILVTILTILVIGALIFLLIKRKW